jgi:hypothetical protein
MGDPSDASGSRAQKGPASGRSEHSSVRGTIAVPPRAAAYTAPRHFGKTAKRDMPCTVSKGSFFEVAAQNVDQKGLEVREAD